MAGMPPALIDRANEILRQLEEKNNPDSQNDSGESLTAKIKDISGPKVQLSIFDAHSATFDEIRTLLYAVDINRLTPVEALLKLQEIKSKLG
jgi:DNA mismatch repair protein MutS